MNPHIHGSAPKIPLEFDLPSILEAREPPEAHGLRRDEVRLLISEGNGALQNRQFCDLSDVLTEGDLLVVNTSKTLPAALMAERTNGSMLELHLSLHPQEGLWIVEAREPGERGTSALSIDLRGETLRLPGELSAHIIDPYGTHSVRQRLWIATFTPRPLNVGDLERWGKPIRYGYLEHDWPIETYQTAYATEPGSAEMPSAGRAFTPELITALIARGILIAPILLHTGVSSLEADEPPYDEFYRVSKTSAQLINLTRQSGGRIIAVGTTVIRALETVTNSLGITHPGEGWTDLIITAQRGIRAVDGLITGFHEPKASHLLMLEALAGRSHLEQSYMFALEHGYLWHEFGDLHLILAERPVPEKSAFPLDVSE